MAPLSALLNDKQLCASVALVFMVIFLDFPLHLTSPFTRQMTLGVCSQREDLAA